MSSLKAAAAAAAADDDDDDDDIDDKLAQWKILFNFIWRF